MRQLPALALLLAAACSHHPVSPLAGAARRGDLEAIRTLTRGGADPNEPSGVNHWTPMMHAIHKNQREAAFALVDNGADINRACCGGMTPLMMAAGYGQEDLVLGLLERGADPRRRSGDGATALDWAITGMPDIDEFTIGKCQTGTVKALLEKAPDAARDQPLLTRVAKALKSCPDIERMLERNRASR